MNSCNFVGNLVSEPLYFEGEISRTVFTLAVDHDGKPVEGKKNCEFLEFVAWRGIAEYVHKYCHKGDLLSIHSRANKREYVNQDGDKTYRTEFVVETLDNVKRAQGNNTLKE